jgi:hypothetical protein
MVAPLADHAPVDRTGVPIITGVVVGAHLTSIARVTEVVRTPKVVITVERLARDASLGHVARLCAITRIVIVALRVHGLVDHHAGRLIAQIGGAGVTIVEERVIAR